jgi:hypothetical protein
MTKRNLLEEAERANVVALSEELLRPVTVEREAYIWAAIRRYVAARRQANE